MSPCVLFEQPSALQDSHHRFFAYETKKKWLYRSAVSSDTTERWVAYHSATLQYKQSYAIATHSFFGNIFPSLLQSNPCKFWSIVNGPKTKNIELCNDLGSVILSARCCEALQNVFRSVFSTDNCSNLPFVAVSNIPVMQPIIIDQLGLFNLILKMKTSAPGMNGITPQFLKQTFHSDYNVLHYPMIGRRGRWFLSPKQVNQRTHPTTDPSLWRVYHVSFSNMSSTLI